MNSEPLIANNLEARIDKALEHKPEPYIAPDFAARVAARAVAQPVRRRHASGQFGKMAALLSAALAAAALFALAPHAAPSVKSLSFDAEIFLLAELALIGVWIARLTADQAGTR